MFDAKDDNTATVTITEKNPKQSNPLKWIALALGTVLGVSHISLIGLLANKKAQLPNLNLPVSEYSSYEATVSSDGYKVRYNSNDPKVLERTQSLDLHQNIDKPGGLFGGAPGTLTLGAAAAPAAAAGGGLFGGEHRSRIIMLLESCHKLFICHSEQLGR